MAFDLVRQEEKEAQERRARAQAEAERMAAEMAGRGR